MSLLSQQGSVSSIVVHFSNQNVFFRLTNNIGEVTNKKSHIRNARKHQILFFFYFLRAAWTWAGPRPDIRPVWEWTGHVCWFVCIICYPALHWYSGTDTVIHIQHIFVWGPRDSNEQRLLLTTTTVMHLYKLRTARHFYSPCLVRREEWRPQTEIYFNWLIWIFHCLKSHWHSDLDNKKLARHYQSLFGVLQEIL